MEKIGNLCELLDTFDRGCTYFVKDGKIYTTIKEKNLFNMNVRELMTLCESGKLFYNV